jgi:hypothetical protein
VGNISGVGRNLVNVRLEGVIQAFEFEDKYLRASQDDDIWTSPPLSWQLEFENNVPTTRPRNGNEFDDLYVKVQPYGPTFKAAYELEFAHKSNASNIAPPSV